MHRLQQLVISCFVEHATVSERVTARQLPRKGQELIDTLVPTLQGKWWWLDHHKCLITQKKEEEHGVNISNPIVSCVFCSAFWKRDSHDMAVPTPLDAVVWLSLQPGGHTGMRCCAPAPRLSLCPLVSMGRKPGLMAGSSNTQTRGLGLQGEGSNIPTLNLDVACGVQSNPLNSLLLTFFFSKSQCSKEA